MVLKEDCRPTDHPGRGTVLIVVVEVTLSIVGFDEASEPPVQSEVRHVVSGKHQEVVGLLPPTYLLLRTAQKLVLNLFYEKDRDKSYLSQIMMLYGNSLGVMGA